MSEEKSIALSIKPYIIRAYYECICDNNLTPYLLVLSRLPNVVVPEKYIDPEDGTIVLNISTVATNKLIISNNALEFQARFDGVIWDIYIPIYAIASIYAYETDEGIAFELDEETILAENQEVSAATATSKPQTQEHPFLRVVKDND